MDGPGYQLVYPDWYDTRAEEECVLKGWLDGAAVMLPDGRRCGVVFMDHARLAQEVPEVFARDGKCYCEPGLIIVPRVDRSSMEAAVQEAARQGYFERLGPRSS